MNLICLEHHFKGEVGNWVKSAYLEVFRCTPLFHQHPSTSHFFCCTIQPALNILNQPDDLNHSIGASVEATVMFGLSLLIAVDVIIGVAGICCVSASLRIFQANPWYCLYCRQLVLCCICDQTTKVEQLQCQVCQMLCMTQQI
jgi:hypothetical protein